MPRMEPMLMIRAGSSGVAAFSSSDKLPKEKSFLFYLFYSCGVRLRDGILLGLAFGYHFWVMEKMARTFRFISLSKADAGCVSIGWRTGTGEDLENDPPPGSRPDTSPQAAPALLIST